MLGGSSLRLVNGFEHAQPAMQEFWRLRPSDPPQEYWFVPAGSLGAHLFAYGYWEEPPCEAAVKRENARPARFGDKLCTGCLDWYRHVVHEAHVG
jgi:hypothetical protein